MWNGVQVQVRSRRGSKQRKNTQIGRCFANINIIDCAATYIFLLYLHIESILLSLFVPVPGHRLALSSSAAPPLDNWRP
jgi:hypothetical protein